jgi:hypothetical protein
MPFFCHFLNCRMKKSQGMHSYKFPGGERGQLFEKLWGHHGQPSGSPKRICSAHFLPKAFQFDKEGNLLKKNGAPVLCHGALPTEELPPLPGACNVANIPLPERAFINDHATALRPACMLAIAIMRTALIHTNVHTARAIYGISMHQKQ